MPKPPSVLDPLPHKLFPPLPPATPQPSASDPSSQTRPVMPLYILDFASAQPPRPSPSTQSPHPSQYCSGRLSNSGMAKTLELLSDMGPTCEDIRPMRGCLDGIRGEGGIALARCGRGIHAWWSGGCPFHGRPWYLSSSWLRLWSLMCTEGLSDGWAPAISNFGVPFEQIHSSFWEYELHAEVAKPSFFIFSSSVNHTRA